MLEGTLFSLLHSDLIKEVDKCLMSYSVEWEPFLGCDDEKEEDIEELAKDTWCHLIIKVPSLMLVSNKITINTLTHTLLFGFLVMPTCGYWNNTNVATMSVKDLVSKLKQHLTASECFTYEHNGSFYRFHIDGEYMEITSSKCWDSGATIQVPRGVGLTIVEKLILYLEDWDNRMTTLCNMD